MFEYLSNAPTPQAISAAYYAIRLIRHRPDIKDVSSAISKIVESSAEERKLVIDVVKEIEGREQSPLEGLSDLVAENYMLELARIAQERSRQEVQQAGVTNEKADELLNELVQTQMVERVLPGLRGSQSEMTFAASDMIAQAADMVARARRDRERWDSLGRDYSARGERYGSGRERSPYDYGYGGSRYRYEEDEDARRDEREFPHLERDWMSDRRLANKITALLEQRFEHQSRFIGVYVNNGEVLLSGIVYDQRLVRIVENVIANIPGVRKVRNALNVSERNSYRDRYYDYGPAPLYGGSRYRRERLIDEDEEDERDRYRYRRDYY